MPGVKKKRGNCWNGPVYLSLLMTRREIRNRVKSVFKALTGNTEITRNGKMRYEKRESETDNLSHVTKKVAVT